MIVRNVVNLVVLAGVWMSVSAKSEYAKILIISMDGFRSDFIDDGLTPTIVKLRSSGVYAPYLRPVFPTKTMTNHHSIATGVFPEVHGVLDSKVYDFKDSSCSNRSIIKYSYELFHYNNDIIPLWTLNQLAGKGRHSGVMMWPGAEFPYGSNQTKPTFFQKHLNNITNEDRVDTVMSWFTHEKTPANLVMMYFEQPDLDAHAYGIDSLEVRDQIKRMDKTWDYIVQQLKKHHLDELVTVFALSDHGGVDIDQNNIIDLDLTKYVNNASYIKAGFSPVWQIFPNKGKEQEVLSGLQKAHADHINKFNIYAREDIPSILHWASNNRTPPFLVLANEGFAFRDFYFLIDVMNRLYHIKPNPRNKYVLHGYMNTYPSMYGIFFAWGPILKSGVVLDPFNSTELYPLWASILKLDLKHEVYFRPNFSMLHSSEPINLETVKLLEWFTGLTAVILMIAMAGAVALFCGRLLHLTAEPVLPQIQRNDEENQHLLESEYEDESKHFHTC